MDNKVLISDRIKDSVLDCIKLTNNNLYNWIHNNGYPIGKISEVEVKALLFGYLKKFLIKTKPDFKRLTKNIKVSITNGLISRVWAMDWDDVYFNDKYLISQICLVCNSLSHEDYAKCNKDLGSNMKLSEIISENKELITFESIKLIKF